MQGRTFWRRMALATGCAMLAGCNDSGDGGAGGEAPTASRLASIEVYVPDTGALSHVMRVSYVDANTATLRPYTAAGEPWAESPRQECVFAPGTVPQVEAAVTRRYVSNGIISAPTGQVLLGVLGLPVLPVTGCQDYFPDRPLLDETLSTAVLDAQGKVGESTHVTRNGDGSLVQRHAGALVEFTIAASGFPTYDETLRYVGEASRPAAMIYGAEQWPEDGSYVDYSDGNIVIDLMLLNTLGGLVQTADGIYVSPAGGYAERYTYDSDGHLTTVRRYGDRGGDGEWLTDDDVPADGGLARLTWANGVLQRVETGLDPADAQPTAAYRNERYYHADGLLQEKRVQDAQDRLVERWHYTRG